MLNAATSVAAVAIVLLRSRSVSVRLFHCFPIDCTIILARNRINLTFAELYEMQTIEIQTDSPVRDDTPIRARRNLKVSKNSPIILEEGELRKAQGAPAASATICIGDLDESARKKLNYNSTPMLKFEEARFDMNYIDPNEDGGS